MRALYLPTNRQFFIRQGIFLLPLLFMLVGVEFFCAGASMESIFTNLRQQSGEITYILHSISSYGNYFFYPVYLALLLWAWKKKNNKLIRLVVGYVLVQLLVTLFAGQLLKWSLGRPRPYMGEVAWQPFLSKNDYHSLPSGHTAEISAASGPFAQIIRAPWGALLLGLLPAIMGFCRIYLGQHHPGDVLAGALLGSVGTWCILRFINK